MQEPTTTYLTPEGKLKLEAELEDLKTNKRRELAERLNFAIKQGDLSENADYIAAKEEQAFLEGRIRTIEGMLRHVTIIEEQSGGEVRIGHDKVQEGHGRRVVQHGRRSRSQSAEGKISNESLLGRALLASTSAMRPSSSPADQVQDCGN
jgi:transcription elongation factor GreA